MAAESMCSIKVGGSSGEMGRAELGPNSLKLLMESAHNFIFATLKFSPLGNLPRIPKVNQGYCFENYTVQSAPYSEADKRGSIFFNMCVIVVFLPIKNQSLSYVC